MVDLVRAYSNAPEVRSDLSRSRAALAGALERGVSEWRSVQSTGRTERAWKLEDIISAETMEQVRQEYVPRVVTHKRLAEKYGISQKSVQRILRQRR